MTEAMNEMVRVACPQCNCKTDRQAEKGCRAETSESGDTECIGMYMPTDDKGYFMATPQAKAASERTKR